jgi:hypothetical protein
LLWRRWRNGKDEDEINGDWMGGPAETQAQDQQKCKRTKSQQIRGTKEEMKSRRRSKKKEKMNPFLSF